VSRLEEGTLREELLSLGTATLGESGARPLEGRLRPMWPGARFAGPAWTVRCAPGDNLAIHVAVAGLRGAAVLAVEVPGEQRCGYFGEVLTAAAQALGAAGLAIDGTVRDLDAIERRQFPVFARGTGLPGTTKVGPGAVNTTVVLDGVVVRPGDWLVGDRDGVVVIPSGALYACRDLASGRAKREADHFRRIGAGETTLSLLGLDPGPVELRPVPSRKAPRGHVISGANGP
jgi:4-hydroxy-4-methyl-2-oxoglutarate aldolase